MEQCDTTKLAATGESDPVYSFKPSLLGAPWEFCLRDDALEWRTGRHQGRAPYDRITRVRLQYRPLTMQTHRFITELWPANGPRLLIASSSWRSLVEQASQIDLYGDFIRDLHRRMVAAGSKAAFQAGMPGLLYWPGFAALAGVSLAIVGLVLRAMFLGEWPAAALLGGFFALFAWQGGNFFYRNRPGRYRPEALPRELVPLRET